MWFALGWCLALCYFDIVAFSSCLLRSFDVVWVLVVVVWIVCFGFLCVFVLCLFAFDFFLVLLVITGGFR